MRAARHGRRGRATRSRRPGAGHRADTQKVSGVYAAAYDSAEGWDQLKREIAAFADAEGRRPRVMIAKLGQDGHDRGAKVVASAFADLGFDVDIGPLFQTAEECARQAIENDVHAVGVSTLAAGHKTLVPAIIEALKAQGARRHRRLRRRRDPARRTTTSSTTPASRASTGRARRSRRAPRTSSSRFKRGRCHDLRRDAGDRRCCAPADQSLSCERARRASGERQRRAVAKAITLLESTRADHRERADALLAALAGAGRAVRCASASRACPASASRPSSRRSACELIGQGHRVAVLAVDPSVERLRRLDPRRQDAHGAALGRHERAFVRPSPSGGTLGGVADGDARGDPRRRGGRLRRRHRRDRRRRPERGGGRRHDRHVPARCSCPMPATTCRRSRRA